MGNEMPMKRYVLFMLCLFSLIICTRQAEATGPIHMQVEVGWNREYKGDFVPVNVSISSSTLIKGQLRVIEKNTVQARDRVLPVKKIEVPSGTTKEFQLLIPNNLLYSHSNWKILLEQEKKILAKQTIGGQNLMKDTLMVGILSDQSDTLSTVNQLLHEIQLRHPVQTYSLKVADIPNIGQALSSFDVLIVSQLSQESLSPTQANAIRTWVSNGGKLLVNGGTYWKNTSEGLEEILPVQLLGKTEKISLPNSMRGYSDLPKEPIPMVDSRLKEGSISLHSQQNHIVMAKKAFYQGQVYFMAYDFAVAPMNQWNGNKQLWDDLYLFTHKDIDSQSRDGGHWFQHLDKLKPKSAEIPEQPKPNLFTLFMLFVVYLLLVGPILFRFLHTKRKKEWAWFGVPICAGIGALVILIYGHWNRGNEVIIYSAGYVQSQPTRMAKVRGISTLFSLDEGDYSVRFPHTFAWPDNNSKSVDQTQYLMDHQEDTHLVLQQMPRWSSQVISTESFQSLGGHLQATLTVQDGKIQAEIANQTQYLIKDIWLLQGDHYLKIGDLKPKERRKMTATMNPNVQKDKNDFGDRILKGNKASIYQYATSINDEYARSKVHLIGWIDQPMMQVKVADYRVKNIGLYMIQGNINVTKNSKGEWNIPYGWLKPELISSDAVSTYDAYTGQYHTKKDGTTLFSYSLGFRPKNIYTLQMNQSRSSTRSALIHEIYNQRTQTWDQQIGAQAIDYLDENGLIWVRVRSQSYAKITPPELWIEGR